jgi:hypothetical protein
MRRAHVTISTPWALLAAGTALVLVVVTVPDGVPQATGHALVNGLSAVAVVVGVRRNRPPNPLPWLAIAGSLTVFAITNVCWALWSADPGLPAVRAIDQGLKPIANLCFSAALFLFLRDGRLARQRSALVDGLFTVLAAGLVLLLWALIADDSPRSLLVIDQVAPFALAGLATGLGVMGHRLGRGHGSASMLALVVAATLVLAGLTLVTVLQPLAPRWVDATWLLASVLNAFAAVHPSAAWPARAGTALSEPRTLVLGAALLTNPVLVWMSVVSRERELLVLSLTVGGIAALALVGMTATDADRSRPAASTRPRHSFKVG